MVTSDQYPGSDHNPAVTTGSREDKISLWEITSLAIRLQLKLPVWSKDIKSFEIWNTPNILSDVEEIFWDFPGCPAVKTLCFHCRGHRSDSWLGNWDPTCGVIEKLLLQQQNILIGERQCPEELGTIKWKGSVQGHIMGMLGTHCFAIKKGLTKNQGVASIAKNLIFP